MTWMLLVAGLMLGPWLSVKIAETLPRVHDAIERYRGGAPR